MATESLTGSLRETLAVFDGPGTPMTTSEVAASLELGRRSTYDRLDRLVDRGRLETKKVGASARVWWRPPASHRDGRSRPDPDWSSTAESLIDDVLDGADVGVFVLDDGFDVVWINEATERYFGLDRERVVGREKRALVEDTLAAAVEDSAAFAETVLATYDDNTGSEQFECHVTPGEGREERWLEHRSEPIETGAYAGGRVELYYDVTDRKRTERVHRSDREKFVLLVDAVDDYAIFMLDPEGFVQTWNPGAEHIEGYDEAEVVGEHVSTFYAADDVEDGLPGRHLEVAERDGTVEDEGWRVREDGSRFWAHTTITAVRDDDGDLRGFAKVTRDLTERREREREMRAERDLLEGILETSPIGISVFYPDGSIDRANTRTADHLALSVEEVEEYNLDDREILDPSGDPLPFEERPVGRVIETCEPVEDQEIRIDDPERGSRWFSMNAAPLADEYGRLERVVAAATDVTELVLQARRLERQHDELAAELEEHFERVDDAFYALDDRMRFTYVNERAEEILGRPEAELLGRDCWTAMGVAPDGSIRERFETAMATQESTTFERYSEALDIWEHVRVYPSESGLSVYFTDVTDRKERERELEVAERRYRTLMDNFPEGTASLFDEEFRFMAFGGEVFEGLGLSADEIEGRRMHDVAPDELAAELEPRYRAVFEGERSDFEVQFGEEVRQFRVLPVYDEDGNVVAGMGISQDVTDRKERERALEESRRWNRTLVENFPSGVVSLVDEDCRYVTLGGTLEGDADMTRFDLEGAPVRDVLPEHIAEVVVPGYDAALDGEPSEFEETIGDGVYQFHFAPVRDDDGEVFAATAMSMDVTDRKERERELRDAKLQLEAATEAGAIGTWEWRIPEDRFVAGASFARTYGVDPEAAREGVPLERFLSAVHEDDRDRVERRIQEAVESCGDYEAEYRVRNANGEFRWVVARGHVECDGDGHPVTFPGALTDITRRKRAAIELERQREQLAALNSLNQVVQDITDAVIEQSTREEIEEVVCAGLAGSASFSFAWIGDVDPATQTLGVRTEAGVDGYLDDVTVSVEPDDERSQGPGGQAFLTREVHVARDVQTDRHFEPWREQAETHGVRSSAGVPIVYDDRVYGVLGVYADRPDAFTDAERRVLGQLGEVVGHAIAAVERKRALMSDEVVELEFQVEDAFSALGVDASFGGRLTLDQTVPVGDGEYLVYGTATQEAWPALDELLEALPHWKAVSELGTWEGTRRFEVLMSDPPVQPVVASRGGYVETARFEDGDYFQVIHLPPTGDVRAVTEAVAVAYPTAELLAQRQFSRTEESTSWLERLVREELTDRQRASLRAAFHAGFFEWPRETTGEEVAASLGVSQPTFHQHLRTAERKVFASLLSGST